MRAAAEPAGGANDDPWVRIEKDLCQGCEACIAACPEGCLGLSEDRNRRGTRYATYRGGCNGCGTCFYVCPEPAAILLVGEPDRDDAEPEACP